MKIFAGHDGSGCAYYRVLQPLGELAAHGHEVTMVPADQRDHGGVTREHMAGHDIIVAQRWDSHEGMGTWRRMRATSQTGVRGRRRRVQRRAGELGGVLAGTRGATRRTRSPTRRRSPTW